MAFSGFQSSGFSSNGFQIIRGQTVAPVTGGGGYYTWEQSRQIQEERARKLRAERDENLKLIQAKEAEIARLEDLRAKDLSNEKLQQDLIQFFQQISLLENERQRLEKMWLLILREDEEIVLLLSTIPFI